MGLDASAIRSEADTGADAATDSGELLLFGDTPTLFGDGELGTELAHRGQRDAPEPPPHRNQPSRDTTDLVTAEPDTAEPDTAEPGWTEFLPAASRSADATDSGPAAVSEPAPTGSGVAADVHAAANDVTAPVTGATEADAAVVLAAVTESPTDSTAPTGICATPLPARIDEWERELRADPHLLGDIAFAIGGPFHVMYPARVAANIAAFRAAFGQAGVDGAVYFGKKANKAACVARACAESGAGVDVSSIGELTSALTQGVRGSELMVTGPAKSDQLLWLAARHDALIAMDSLDELDRLAAFTTPATPARVLLRALPTGSTSRFGMTGAELDHALSAIGSSGTVGHESIRLEGFSFHLSGYDAIARAAETNVLIARCQDARLLGHPVTTISIGGGFGVDYVTAAAWTQFTEHANPHWFHAGKSSDSYYPYHFPTPGAAMLTAILAHGNLAERLRDNDIRLAIEPGRALLDRAGSTIFRVQGSKTRHSHGQPYRILTVDGTSLSLSEQWFDSEYLPDPVLWPARPDGELTPTCVGAATCLDSDMLSRRRVPLPRRAEVGDLLIYPNTAGYQMDSNESAFHELPIPPKIVLYEAPGGRFRWTHDAG